MTKKKILVLCPAPVGVSPGQRLKYEQYFDHFEQNGYELTISSFMNHAFWNIAYKKGHFISKLFWTIIGYMKRIMDFFRLHNYDGVYIFLWVTPFGSTLFERVTVLLSKRIVYDIDDLVFLKPKSTANPIVQLFKSGQKPIYLMKKSHHVITCTPYLDEFAGQYNKNTTDISSTINTETYQVVNSYNNDELITIGWTGSFSTSIYLNLVEQALERVQETHPFRLVIIGAPDFSFKNIKSENIQWTAETEVQDIQKIDIGLYPLPNDDWIKGKSGLKALMYMALGIPTIASAVGTNFRIIDDGVSGFLAENDQQWIDRIIQLIENPSLRKSLGEKGREKVEDIYSINANKATYLSILDNTY